MAGQTPIKQNVRELALDIHSITKNNNYSCEDKLKVIIQICKSKEHLELKELNNFIYDIYSVEKNKLYNCLEKLNLIYSLTISYYPSD